MIEKLAALLRVANALDRTHAARVVELYASLVKRRRVVVELLSPFDVSLELAAARHRAGLFERLFGRRLEFRQGLEPAAPRAARGRRPTQTAQGVLSQRVNAAPAGRIAASAEISPRTALDTVRPRRTFLHATH